MKPLVRFADPEAALITYLTTKLVGRSESYAPAVVAVNYPSIALTGTTTQVQVDLELGNADDYPITESAQVRVVCHAAPGKRTNVKALASLAEGLLYAHPGDEYVAGVFIQTGRSSVSTDPDTGNLMCWFLVRVALKANPITA